MSLTNITYDDYLTYDVGIQVEIQQDYCYAPAAALSIESLVAAFQTRHRLLLEYPGPAPPWTTAWRGFRLPHILWLFSMTNIRNELR